MPNNYDDIIRRAMAESPPVVADVSEAPVSPGTSYSDIIQQELLNAGALKSDNKQLNPPQDLSINLPYQPERQRTSAIPWMRNMHNMRPSENVIDRRNETIADKVLRELYYTFRGTQAGGSL
jgi:hypothetical protein